MPISSLIFILHHHRYTAEVENNNKLQNLKPDSLIITGNLRLARYLQEEYGRLQIAAGFEAWPQPKIMHWQSWLNQSWQEAEHHSKLQLLSDPQARLVWEQVINAHLDDHFSLLNLHASARSAQSAWRLLNEHEYSLDNLGQHVDEDVAVFRLWAQAYSEKCVEQHWLDEARLGEYVYYSIETDQLSLPSEVLLAGLEELTPIQKKIISQLETKGVTVGDLFSPDQSELSDRATQNNKQSNQTKSNQKRLSLQTTRDEIKAAALWARQQVTQDPETKIAIVIPQLASVRVDVVRILDQALCPAVILPGNQDIARPYDISLGLPLGEYPVVFDALLMLECLNHRMPMEKVGRLLASSFSGDTKAEHHARALLDAWLREKGASSIRIDILARQAKGLDKNGEAEPHACPLLVTRLVALVELKTNMPTRQSSHEWAKLFITALNTLGWPGDRSLSSTENQTVVRFREILESLAGMEQIAGLITLHEALRQLRNLANEIIFQPKSEAKPILVLDVLAEKILTFDALWVMGLHDEVWPQVPRPHPLLPVRLQRELDMPHASAEKELQHARALTDAMKASAKEVIVSSPQRDGDKALRPSPLITDIAEGTFKELVSSQPEDYAQTIYKFGQLELVDFVQPPPMFTGTDITRGGTGLIKQQAQCPFSAFARYRLGAQPLAESREGLSAMERGSLVHRVLELLWGSIKTQDTLLNLADEELNKVISQSVQYAIDEQAKFNPEIFTSRFIEIEANRLTRLMTNWLALEKERSPFKVIAPEKKQFVTIAGMTLKLIIDRIDELESGERLLIDYKTGANNNLNNWFDDRPQEPQLPMYSYLGSEAGQAPAALAFAQLAAGDLKFIGLGNQDGIAQGIKDIAKDDKRGAVDWATQINDWKKVLENLAQQYVNGEASVNPKDDNSCTYCPYPELCRINELNQRLGHLMEASEE